MSTVQVAVDNATFHFDKLYTYRLPLQLEGQVFEGSMVLVLDIADDGTFCKKFLASYPVHNSFIADDSKVRFNAIRFFARPGETIDVTVRKASFCRY